MKQASIEAFSAACDAALAAKKEYEHRVAIVAGLRRDAEFYCREQAKRLERERADLYCRVGLSYREGERLKDEIMRQGLWPSDSKGPTYAEALRSITPENRSPKMSECLRQWEEFESATQAINEAFPPPQYFRWNGNHLVIAIPLGGIDL